MTNYKDDGNEVISRSLEIVGNDRIKKNPPIPPFS
jgi:hypothetical protein